MLHKRNTLTAFVRQNCANFNKSNDDCLLQDKTCKILVGKPCGYFRAFVLRGCDPTYPYAINTKLYPRLAALYRKLDPAFENKDQEKKVRLCGCGQSLKPGHRLCDKCQKKHRRQSYRKYRMSAPQLTAI